IFPDYGNYFTLNLEGLGLKDGTYTLTIPEGYVNLSVYGVSTEPCVQQTLSITIGGNVEVTYPVNITAINGNYFEITWENVTSLAEGNTTGAYIREITTGQKYDMLYLEDYYYSRANLRIDNGNVLCVNITNNYPDLPSGTYSLYLPEGYVKFNGTQTVNKAIDDHRFTYTRPWSEGRVEFDGPSADNKLTLTWIDASEILYDTSYPGDGNSITGITIFDGAETQINVAYGENITINKNVMTVDLNGLKIAAGECRILVPEECLFVTVDGETDYTYGVAFSFTYGTPDTPDTPELYTGDAIWNVKTGDTVKAGSYVEVGWGDFPLSFIDGAECASIHTFETGILYLNYGSEVTLTPDGKRIRLDLSNMPDGAFRVNVPEACVEFKVDGVTYRNQGTSMDGIIISNGSSLTDIAADATGRYRVYSLTGILVLDTTSPLDLTTLPRGIYIVNGKKVVK
ncbi:MAG: hypothetical protein J1E29_08680, partial [Duncaniella sp.]|nr:hypothetical protein [Duncaniella sp.]